MATCAFTGNILGEATSPRGNIFLEAMRHMGILSLSPRYGPTRLDAACERALTINAITYSSVNAILKAGLDLMGSQAEPAKPTPAHANIRGRTYYQ
ncbi:hypothetical protein MesoLj131a_63020 [Mesorhizobium sp. 131-2-1]|nr:hypothetical protein MesoLj131a_63020 [Mesorhizobium sp. 131-2-1]BCH04508.1 hypothetical protein MesoLj131b_65070 [Mesorhizobium sp. 131-2-5]